MSESGLSGRHISGGGSSPNSSLSTSAREVISQHSIERDFRSCRYKEREICDPRAIQSSPFFPSRLRAGNRQAGRDDRPNGASLGSLGMGCSCLPGGRRSRGGDSINRHIHSRLESLRDAISGEVRPRVVLGVKLLVEYEISEVGFHGGYV